MTEVKNPQIELALKHIEAGHNVFITGKAGTGKSTLLQNFRKQTRIPHVVLASTGVAALNIEGETIHSFFRFPPNIVTYQAFALGKKAPNKDLYSSLKCIIIDEISMVRADLLDCIDAFLKGALNSYEPFAGIQLVFFGDLYQLPPVLINEEKERFFKEYKSAYFFDAKIMQTIELNYVELEKIYRQSDPRFIEILNEIRNNTLSYENLNYLNKNLSTTLIDTDGYVFLSTTNKTADHINRVKLGELDKPVRTLVGAITGEFNIKNVTTDKVLYLKEGAQVMTIVNKPEHGYVNGTIATVSYIDNGVIVIKLKNGLSATITPHTWKAYKYDLDALTGKIIQKQVGTFLQYPIRLSYAVTIHKSQGKTLDKVILCLESGMFQAGQLYVALSRCISLDNLVLTHPVRQRHVMVDPYVVKFVITAQCKQSNREFPLKEKVKFIKEAIRDNKNLKVTYIEKTGAKKNIFLKPVGVGKTTNTQSPYYALKGICCATNEQNIYTVSRMLNLE